MKRAEDLSRYEFCPRLPSLLPILEPRQFSVREAVRRYFELGVSHAYSGVPEPWITIPMEFLGEAAERGYTYPEGEPYVIAQDHASWLEGALRTLPDLHPQPLPLVDLDGDFVEVNGYLADGEAHLFRVLDAFDAKVRWPELLLVGLYPVVNVHVFRLPRVSKGRLPSPACMAYAHPMTGQLRLARLEGESSGFSQSWKRHGRWELQDTTWQDWEDGIRRDRCLDQITRSHQVASADYSAEEVRDIRNDAAMMLAWMGRPQPRQRETCGSCMFLEFCHGGESGRHAYIGPGESVRYLRPEEAANVVS